MFHTPCPKVGAFWLKNLLKLIVGEVTPVVISEEEIVP